MSYNPEESLIPAFIFDLAINDKQVPFNIGVYSRIVDGSPIFTLAYQKDDGSWHSDGRALQRPLNENWVVGHYGGIDKYVKAHIESWNKWLEIIDPETAVELKGLFKELADYLSANLVIGEDRLTG